MGLYRLYTKDGSTSKTGVYTKDGGKPLQRAVFPTGFWVYTKDGGKPLQRAVFGEVERDIKGHSSAIAQSGLRKG